MTALNVVGIGKEELQKERESLLEVKKILEEQLAVLKVSYSVWWALIRMYL